MKIPFLHDSLILFFRQLLVLKEVLLVAEIGTQKTIRTVFAVIEERGI